jgi:hypothetical protein
MLVILDQDIDLAVQNLKAARFRQYSWSYASSIDSTTLPEGDNIRQIHERFCAHLGVLGSKFY